MDTNIFLDTEDALKRLGGNEAVYRMLLGKFLKGGTDAALKSAVADGGTEGIRAAAHTLKGLAANLSMPSLREAAATLEAAVKNGEPTDNLPEAVYAAWDGTADAVQMYLGK